MTFDEIGSGWKAGMRWIAALGVLVQCGGCALAGDAGTERARAAPERTRHNVVYEGSFRFPITGHYRYAPAERTETPGAPIQGPGVGSQSGDAP